MLKGTLWQLLVRYIQTESGMGYTRIASLQLDPYVALLMLHAHSPMCCNSMMSHVYIVLLRVEFSAL